MNQELKQNFMINHEINADIMNHVNFMQDDNLMNFKTDNLF